jgi:cob(I)alamin adenosyltransferase
MPVNPAKRRPMMSKEYIQGYTGNGKGETTAALGLAFRAAGAVKKVFIAQFVNGKQYSEMEAIEKFITAITIKQYGLGCFIVQKPTEDDIPAARNGLAEITEILNSGDYDVVILDEITIALYYRFFSINEFSNVMKKKNPETKVAFTGRHAPPELIEMADLVAEMKEVKYYYTNGIEARKGIEY